jgi:hypothetical protein
VVEVPHTAVEVEERRTDYVDTDPAADSTDPAGAD